MSVREELFTVAELANRFGLIVVNCRNCSHRSMFYATELTHRGAGRRPVRSLSFQCRNCGKRRVPGTAYVPFTIR